MTGKSEIDLEAEYNNRARVPDHPAVIARWKSGSEKARAAHPPATVAYGPGPREVMDLFEAGDGAPWAVFLHGGYWQALDKDWFSFVAPPLLAHGVYSRASPRQRRAVHRKLAELVEEHVVDLLLRLERVAADLEQNVALRVAAETREWSARRLPRAMKATLTRLLRAGSWPC